MTDIKITTEVMYTCRVCGLEKIPLKVPAREQEDVVVWVEQTVRHVHVDHQQRTPGCAAEGVDLYIPTDGTDRVGGPVVT